MNQQRPKIVIYATTDEENWIAKTFILVWFLFVAKPTPYVSLPTICIDNVRTMKEDKLVPV